MFRVKVHKHIEQITEIFYRVGFWHHRQYEETVAKWTLKFFYSIHYFLFPVSLMAVAIGSDNKDEKVFLVEASIMSAVVLVKLLHIIWRRREILELLINICDYDVEDRGTFTQIKNELNILMKYVTVYCSLCYFCGLCTALVAPFLGTEKRIFFNIGFPLDYKKKEFAFWMAFAFIFTEINITAVALLFSGIVWYLLTNCSLRYVVLGQQIKVMGQIKDNDGAVIKMKISNAQRDNLYQRDLIEAITTHQYLEESTNRLGSFLNNLFVAQQITSALCVCASVYCLAFNRGDNLIESLINLIFLLYNIFDIFMVMYLGNDLQLASDRLSYCLFESDWVDRSQSIKKKILIFGERLMKPHQLVVLKIYPLNLETFMRILNSAYSMLNILQNVK